LIKKTSASANIWILAPVLGTLIFVILYVIASLFYPGGSQADVNSKGFSWINNYWCNLTNEKAINGQQNTAKPIAIAAMFVRCLTLAVFWYIFPKQVGFIKFSRLSIQISGALAMFIGMFLFTDMHDTIVNIASICGLVATTGTYAGLYKLKWKGLFWLGILNLIFIFINNILYYGEGLRSYLPIVQKITFLFFLLWICLITINLYHRQRR